MEQPTSDRALRWVLLVCAPLGLCVAALTLFGLLALYRADPSRVVIEGPTVSEDSLELLRAHGIVDPGERVVLFYSYGAFSILEGGNLITDRRVVSYVSTGGELAIDQAPFSEIEDVTVEVPGGMFSDTLIRVSVASGEDFYVQASTEEGGDRRFIDELERQLAMRRS